jgi:hypothetical protein
MVQTAKFIYNAYGGDRYFVNASFDADTLVIDGADNTAPANDPNQPVTAKTRKDGRAIGIQARKVRLRYINTRPPGYSDWTVLVPVFRPNRWDDFTIGKTGTFRGEAVIVVGRIPQKVN